MPQKHNPMSNPMSIYCLIKCLEHLEGNGELHQLQKTGCCRGRWEKMHPSDILHLPSRLQRYRSNQYLVESFGSWEREQGVSLFKTNIGEENKKLNICDLLTTSCSGRNFCVELQEQTWGSWCQWSFGGWRSLERQAWAAYSCIWDSVCPTYIPVQWARGWLTKPGGCG